MGGLPNAQPMSMSAKQPVLEEGHGMADMEGMGGMHGGMGGLAGTLVSAPGGQISRSEGWAGGGESWWPVATSSLLDHLADAFWNSPGLDVSHPVGLLRPDLRVLKSR